MIPTAAHKALHDSHPPSAISRAERINAALGRWRGLLAGASSKVPLQLVDLLAENPFWTIRRAASRLGVAYSTAHRAMHRLLAHSILAEVTNGQRSRVYCAQEILDILEEPARLTPR